MTRKPTPWLKCWTRKPWPTTPRSAQSGGRPDAHCLCRSPHSRPYLPRRSSAHAGGNGDPAQHRGTLRACLPAVNPHLENRAVTALQTLRHGLRGLGVRVTSGRGWVTISTIDGAWSETFDSAADALQWACAARLAHIDQCKP